MPPFEMKIDTTNEKVLKRYLLGQSSDEESQALEERFLANDEFFDEMVALEDELYYEYSDGELNAAERSAFEQRFLRAHEDRNKAAFAGTLVAITAELAAESTIAQRAIVTEEHVPFWKSIGAFFGFSGSVLQYGMAAASLLLLLGFSFAIYQNINLRREVAALDAERIGQRQEQDRIIAEKQNQQAEIERELEVERARASQNESRIDEIETERAKLQSEIDEARRKADQLRQVPGRDQRGASSPGSILALALSPGHFVRSDGADMSRIKLTPATDTVRIDLTLKNAGDYPRFRTVVRKVDDGSQVYATKGVSPALIKREKHLIVSIPAFRLSRADYEIVLIGIKNDGVGEEVTNYYFSVDK